jgi:hypothetical protein
MVAPRKTRRVVCTVIEVPVSPSFDFEATERPSSRLPWSDPTIARLVANLQDEVRTERLQAKLSSKVSRDAIADLDPPTPTIEDEWDWRDQPRWNWPD